MKTIWDYSDRAYTYDKRADYSAFAINSLIQKTIQAKTLPVADIGAGTGKLTKMILRHSLRVNAVEPNTNMRAIGIENTKGQNVTWIEGLGEATGLLDNSVQAAFFGSSFNVVDQNKALKEVARILIPNGWFACMWNHRDLSDSLQKKIEEIIHKFVPDFDYGKRRQDPTKVIDGSNLFGKVEKIEERFVVSMNRIDIIDAWKSHGTLHRQSSDNFDRVIEAISKELTSEVYKIPYFTRIWFSKSLVNTLR